MALEFDIKANDEFKASIEGAADGLERAAKHEQELNAMTDRLGRAYKEAAGYAQNLSQRTREAIGATSLLYGQSEKIAQVGKTDRSKMLATVNKEYAVQKKENVERKKWLDIVKGGALHIAAMGAGLLASAAAAAALAYKLADAGKGAFEARREAGALLDAWTGQRGPKALQLIDGLAMKIGLSFQDARAKFLEFREAGLNNKLSAKLLMIRQDLIALGLSAENADKEISRVTSVGHDPYARIRAIRELENAYRGVGSGAYAAYYALHSVEGAQTKISNAVTPMLADFWKKIGPDIGNAANRLADFGVELLKSKEGKEIIESVASAIRDMAKSFNETNFQKVIQTLRDIAWAFDKIAIGAKLAWKAVQLLTGQKSSIDISKDITDALVPKETQAKWDKAANDAVSGFVKGVSEKASSAAAAAKAFADTTAKSFADALGIQSPSKVFAEYGRQTVAGYERGQVQALGGGDMPIERSATVRPAKVVRSGEVRSTQDTQVGPSIVIENLTVEGGTNATADDIARAIRRELQLLLNAGALSRGYA